MKARKRGVSPVVATILLVMIVIILAIIILLWSRGFVKEAISKDIGGDKKNIELFCKDVSIEPILDDSSGDFGFKNVGVVPIYGFYLKTSKEGSTDSSKIDKPVSSGLPVMVSELGSYDGYSEYESISVIPILLGKKEKTSSIEPYECPEKYSTEIYKG